MYSPVLSGGENAEAMMKPFLALQAQVISQAISRKSEEFSKCLFQNIFPSL
jgi:hypothetical protein